ncbi:MAG: hypothetical protein J6B77_04160, partial [Clostridia bacterium]|nr:hypothetical protein [Clostridia bacterium]
MKSFAIVCGSAISDVQKKAVSVLSEILLDGTVKYPYVITYDETADLSSYRCIYIGTKESNPYIRAHSDAVLSHAEGYAIRIKNDTVVIEGADDRGVLYGCMDFYNEFVLKVEHPGDEVRYVHNCFEKPFPDFERISHPAVRDRGIWTWGHVIYDYRGFIDNLVRLKMNTLILWNDRVPFNARKIVAYAHSCGVKVIWGYAWAWNNGCKNVDLATLCDRSVPLFEQYEREYADIGADGIYFQSVTEFNKETIDGVLIADAVTQFVNHTAGLFFDKYPDLELQFGLHATSVKHRLEYIGKVDPRIRIVWENCGAFPFSYTPYDVAKFDETKEFVSRIAHLRGEDDRFGVVTKGLTKLYWPEFEHMEAPMHVGVSSERMQQNRITRKHRIWKYLQAYWITHADYVSDMIRLMAKEKDGDLYITALVEDGMFEKEIMYPVAL